MEKKKNKACDVTKKKKKKKQISLLASKKMLKNEDFDIALFSSIRLVQRLVCTSKPLLYPYLSVASDKRPHGGFFREKENLPSVLFVGFFFLGQRERKKNATKLPLQNLKSLVVTNQKNVRSIRGRKRKHKLAFFPNKKKTKDSLLEWEKKCSKRAKKKKSENKSAVIFFFLSPFALVSNFFLFFFSQKQKRGRATRFYRFSSPFLSLPLSFYSHANQDTRAFQS